MHAPGEAEVHAPGEVEAQAPGEAEPAGLLRAERTRIARGVRAPVLDLACGRGRNALALARDGVRVVGLDRSRERLLPLSAAARTEGLPLAVLRADLERSDTIPLASASCAAVLVFRYLHRPLAPEIERVLQPGGLLLYETFTVRHREVAEHPGNPAFLLEADELPGIFPGLATLRYEEALVRAPTPEAVARLVARKPG